MKVRIDGDTEKYKVFRKPETFLTWLKHEYDAWSWIGEIEDNYSRQLSSQILTLLNDNIKFLEESISKDKKEDIQISSDDVANRVNSAIIFCEYFPSSSNYFHYIMDVKEQDPVLAATAVFLRNSQQKNVNFSIVVANALSVNIIYSLGLTGIDPSTNKSLEKLNAEFDAVFSKSANDVEEKIDYLEGAIKKKDTRLKRSVTVLARWLKHKRTQQKDRGDAALAEASTKVENLIKTSQAEIDEFRTFVQNQISLQAPIEYWKTKKTVALSVDFFIWSIVCRIFDFPCQTFNCFGKRT